MGLPLLSFISYAMGSLLLPCKVAPKTTLLEGLGFTTGHSVHKGSPKEYSILEPPLSEDSVSKFLNGEKFTSSH